MNRRYSTVLRQAGSSVIPQLGAAYIVTAYPVGTFASANSSGSTFTVDAGHSFVAGDKVLIAPGGNNIFSGSNSVSSVTATSIVMTGGSYSVSAGDAILNLGPDSGTASPNYNGSPMAIYSDQDGTTAITNSTVTCTGAGEYGFWHRGDGAFWELIRNSAGTVVDFVAGHAIVQGRINVADYGCKGDDSTNNTTRLQQAFVQASELTVDSLSRHNRVYLPCGVYRVTGLSAWVLGTNRNRLIIEGDGPDNTVIRGTDTTSNVLTISGNYTSIRDLTVDSTAARTAGGSTAYADGTATAGAHGIAMIPNDTSTTQIGNELFNVYSEGHPDDGVFAQQPEQLYMVKVVSSSNGRFGFHLNGQTNGIGTQNKAETCRAYQNVGRGWYIRTINHSTFINCESLQCDAATEFFYLHGGRGNTLIEPDIEDATFNTATGLLVVGEKHKSIGGIFFGFQTPISLSSATNCWIVLPHISNSGLGTNADVHVRIANVSASDNYLHLGTLSSTADALYTFAAAAPGCTVIGDEDITALTADSQTPSVKGGHRWKTANTVATTITNFLQGYIGQTIFVLVNDDNTTFDFTGTTLKGNGARNWTAKTGDSLRATWDGTNWSVSVSQNVTTDADVNVTGNDAIASVGRESINLTNVSGTNTITLTAPASVDGKVLRLRCAALTAGTITLADSGNCALSAAWVPDAGDTLTLIAKGVVWYETARSAN